MNKNDLSPIVIDFNQKKQLQEFSIVRFLGVNIKAILKSLFSGIEIPVTVRGSKRDVNSFINTLSGEKRYIDSLRKYGLDNPSTYRDKQMLDSSISQFERQTGIKWPFK